jgi:Cdc6-like AAA superfamily ATPase
MMNPKFFPTVLIILDLAAAGVYLSHGDVRRLIYWSAAAVLTATVTY